MRFFLLLLMLCLLSYLLFRLNRKAVVCLQICLIILPFHFVYTDRLAHLAQPQLKRQEPRLNGELLTSSTLDPPLRLFRDRQMTVQRCIFRNTYLSHRTRKSMQRQEILI